MYLLYCMYILYAQVTFGINPKGFYLESEFSKPRIHSQKEKKNNPLSLDIESGPGERRKR